jgi:hypothetical protein
VGGTAKHGLCVPGKDGKLHVQAGDSTPARALAR